MKSFSFFNWITGFVVLLSLDFLFEGLIFEILNWNGTTKNDWFFIFVVGISANVVFVWQL